MNDQRDTARLVCTPAEYRSWYAVEVKGLSKTKAARELGISPSTVADHLKNVNRKLANHNRNEFNTRPKPPFPEVRSTHRLIIGLLIQRDGPCCYLCGRHVPANQACVEHIIPRHHGGTDDPENLALACEECNLEKGITIVSLRTTSGLPVYHHD